MRHLLFLKIRLWLLVLPGLLLTGIPLHEQELLDPASVPKFINKLPIPSVIDATNSGNRSITIKISQFEQDLGLGLKSESGNPVLTTVWGYNGQYPGPTFVAKKDQAIKVKWLNRLVDDTGMPLPHLLPVDKSIHWADLGGPLQMPEPAAARVRLYDLSGRLVRKVPSRRLPAGHHQLELNGADMQTGMYVFEVEVNDKRYRSKVVLSR